jgi:hypothetical protein
VSTPREEAIAEPRFGLSLFEGDLLLMLGVSGFDFYSSGSDSSLRISRLSDFYDYSVIFFKGFSD